MCEKWDKKKKRTVLGELEVGIFSSLEFERRFPLRCNFIFGSHSA